MSEYVARISQEGYDANKCPDDKLLFSSEFPTLQIVSEKTVTLNKGFYDPAVEICSHNLGYFPAFACYYLNNKTFASDFYSGIQTSCDKSKIWLDSADVESNIRIHYYIFNWNLQTNYQSPIENITQRDKKIIKDFESKISKDGFDVTKCELKNQVLNSNGRTPIIHQSGYGRNDAYVDASISHNLGYIPMFISYYNHYIYGSPPYNPVAKYYLGKKDILVPSVGISAQDNITNTTLSIQSPVVGLDYAYLIFKDPVL